MKVTTWNVNGIRAREHQVMEWLTVEKPDVLCLQEIKASPEAVPHQLLELPGYWSLWHGHKGYSGVALLLRKAFFPGRPAFSHPDFDVDCRIVVAEVGQLVLASIYVPNGNRNYDEKVVFLKALDDFARAQLAAGKRLLLCGDLNVARTELDVHPTLRQPTQLGQTPAERAMLEHLLGHGLTDLGRHFDPTNERLFTWWAPWRNLRELDVGWRLDYQLASAELTAVARRCEALRTFGTSDHGPVTASYDLQPFVGVADAPAAAPRSTAPAAPQLGFDF